MKKIMMVVTVIILITLTFSYFYSPYVPIDRRYEFSDGVTLAFLEFQEVDASGYGNGMTTWETVVNNQSHEAIKVVPNLTCSFGVFPWNRDIFEVGLVGEEKLVPPLEAVGWDASCPGVNEGRTAFYSITLTTESGAKSYPTVTFFGRY